MWVVLGAVALLVVVVFSGFLRSTAQKQKRLVAMLKELRGVSNESGPLLAQLLMLLTSAARTDSSVYDAAAPVKRVSKDMINEARGIAEYLHERLVPDQEPRHSQLWQAQQDIGKPERQRFAPPERHAKGIDLSPAEAVS